MSNERFSSYNGGESLPERQGDDFERPVEDFEPAEEPERFRMGPKQPTFELADVEAVAEEIGVMPPEVVTEEVDTVSEEGGMRLVDRAEKSIREKDASDANEDMQKLRRENLAIYGYHGGDDYGGVK